MKDEYLLGLVEGGGRHIWAGSKMPFSMHSIDILCSNNFRLSSSLHHQFETVWFYEELFDSTGRYSWKIVLDELIRLFKGEGKLVIRMRENETPSLFQVKNFLGRHLGIDCTMEYESCDEVNNIWTTVYSIKRKDIEKYDSEKWSFIMLTLGDKVDAVIKFIKSVRENEQKNYSEIIIAGPKNESYNVYDVKYIDWTPFVDAKYPEICKKKNAAIELATNENTMIVHDRYILGENFFKGFKDYGYDFDFVTVKQYTLDGLEYPSYAATRKKLRLCGQVMVNNSQKLYDTSYLNGGLIIAKTHMLKSIPFNNMMLWSQMEDAELSKVFIDNSLVPRINFLSKTITLVLKEGYLASWVIDDTFDFEKEIENRGIEDVLLNSEEPYGMYSKIARKLPIGLKKSKIYMLIKSKLAH